MAEHIIDCDAVPTIPTYMTGMSIFSEGLSSNDTRLSPAGKRKLRQIIPVEQASN